MGKLIKVLMVNPPSLTEVPEMEEGLSYYEWLKLKNKAYEFIPGELLGCQCIQSYVEKNNIDCSIDILNSCVEMHTSIEQTLKEIEKKMPLDVVAFTGPYSVFSEIEYLAQAIKNSYPETCIVYGQFFASLCCEAILENYPFFDFVCIGYGEITISKIIEYKQGVIRIQDIPAVGFKNKYNKFILNSIESNTEKIIKVIPTRYDIEKVKKTGLCISIFCSRGCPYRCSFCATGSLMRRYGHCTPFSLRHPISVVDEIQYLHEEFNINRFTFVDDTFAANTAEAKKQAKEIALEIVKRNLNIQIMIDTRIDCIDEDLFVLLKNAGVVKAFVGIEAANNNNLLEYNKGYKTDVIFEKIKILENLGIEIVPGFITFNPDSTVDELRSNADLIRNIPNSDPSMFSYEYIPYPGTDLTNKFIKDGLVVGNFPNYENNYKNPEVKLIKQTYDRLLTRYSTFLINRNKEPNFDIDAEPLIKMQIHELFADYFNEIIEAIELEKQNLLDDIYSDYNQKLMEQLKMILLLEVN